LSLLRASRLSNSLALTLRGMIPPLSIVEHNRADFGLQGAAMLNDVQYTGGNTHKQGRTTFSGFIDVY
jgi:hypothetical protein